MAFLVSFVVAALLAMFVTGLCWVRNPKPETRNPKTKTRNTKHETLNPKP